MSRFVVYHLYQRQRCYVFRRASPLYIICSHLYTYTSQGYLELSQDLMHSHRRRETFIICILLYMGSTEGALYNPGILLLEAACNVEVEFELEHAFEILDAAIDSD